MTGQIVLRSSPSETNRRQPLLHSSLTSPINSSKSQPTKTLKKSTSNVGEVAGETAANICVVCCCCPFVVVEFLILAVYKVPKSMVRRMLKKQRQKMFVKRNKKKGIVLEYGNDVKGVNWGYQDCYVDDTLSKESEMITVSVDGSAAEVVELDKLMWERFRDGGFWRSPSQRFNLV